MAQEKGTAPVVKTRFISTFSIVTLCVAARRLPWAAKFIWYRRRNRLGLPNLSSAITNNQVFNQVRLFKLFQACQWQVNVKLPFPPSRAGVHSGLLPYRATGIGARTGCTARRQPGIAGRIRPSLRNVRAESAAGWSADNWEVYRGEKLSVCFNLSGLSAFLYPLFFEFTISSGEVSPGFFHWRKNNFSRN